MSLPTGWKLVRLADVAVKKPNAIVDGPFGSNLKLTDYVEDGVPVLQGKNITGNKFQWFGVRFISEKKANSLKRSLVKEGDILIVKIGSIGYSAQIDDLQGYPHALIPANLCKVTPDLSIVDPTFLVYYLNSNKSVEYLRSNASATSQPALSLSKVKELPVPLPPLPEQRRIANLLSRADRLRRLRRVGDTLSASLLQSVFLEMFGNLLNDNIKTKFSDVLEIPLTNGFFEMNEKYGEGTPIVWVDNLYHTNFIDVSELRRVRTSKSAIEKYEVIEGDLLFTRSSLVDEGVGQVNIMPIPLEKTMFESHVIRARVDKTRVNPIYIHALYRSQFAKIEIMKRAKTATMTTIGQDTIYELPCPVPLLSEQEQFAAVVRRVEGLRRRQAESARQGEGLFQSLLARVFGESL